MRRSRSNCVGARAARLNRERGDDSTQLARPPFRAPPLAPVADLRTWVAANVTTKPAAGRAVAQFGLRLSRAQHERETPREQGGWPGRGVGTGVMGMWARLVRAHTGGLNNNKKMKKDNRVPWAPIVLAQGLARRCFSPAGACQSVELRRFSAPQTAAPSWKRKETHQHTKQHAKRALSCGCRQQQASWSSSFGGRPGWQNAVGWLPLLRF